MNRIRVISLGISLFIHTTVIGVMSGSGWVARWVSPIPIKKEDRFVLEFVEVPEEVQEIKTQKDIKTISDKTVSAKDMIKERIKEMEARRKHVSKGKQIAKASLQIQDSVPQTVSKPIDVTGRGEVFQQRPVVEGAKPPEIGYDVINLPSVSESIFSTPEEGPLTFEAKAHKVGPYFKKVKQRIEKYWLSYLVFRYQNISPQENEVIISFKILPTGEVTDVNVLEYCGDELFKEFCVAAIVNTSPFPPLPDNLEKDLEEEGGLNIVFTFRYR